MSHRSRNSRDGFTLLEMVLSMAIVTLLLGAVESALLLSARAIPDGRSASSNVIVCNKAIDMLSQDLFFANSVTLTSATDVTLTVPTRKTGSGNDTIRYYWDTTSTTTPLVRQVNGSATNLTTVANNVKEFALVYDRRQVQNSQTYSESAEQVLSSYSSVTSLTAWPVTTTNWVGEYFVPTLPANATAWKVSKVQFYARSDGSTTGVSSVQLRTPSSGLPGTLVDSVSLSESTLTSSYTQQTISFTKATGLTPGSGLCFSVLFSSNSPTCDIEYQNTSAIPSNCNLISTTASGSPWTSQTSQSLLFNVLGTVTTPDTASYKYYLTGVRATIRAGSDSNGRVNTSIRVVNEPQVTGP